MEIEVENHPRGVTVAVLSGRFDTTGAVAIELPFNTLATEKAAIVIDLSNVNFMSSYGIRVLLKGAKIAKGKNGNLVIFCPDNAVRKVLNTAGASDLIPVHPTRAAAIAAAAAG
jgi:anti-anti-sigma factor